jgi:hypothetical protein
MSLIESIAQLDPPKIEAIEKLTLRWVFQALFDFGFEAYAIFQQSPDHVTDIAEDITREALDRLQGFNLSQRILGTVDYKRARYVILPDFTVRQALFVDSKAEQTDSSATLQLSQTSMAVRQLRDGVAVDETGGLPAVARYAGKEYLTTTVFLHFYYTTHAEIAAQYNLQSVTLFCVPNGLLQAWYNPNTEETFWLVGRNAPSRDEKFRVRVSFARLRAKARWRVQHISYLADQDCVNGTWDE